MIPPAQFLEHVIRPTLNCLAVAEPRLGTEASANLMLGTAIAESNLSALVQYGLAVAALGMGLGWKRPQKTRQNKGGQGQKGRGHHLRVISLLLSFPLSPPSQEAQDGPQDHEPNGRHLGRPPLAVAGAF